MQLPKTSYLVYSCKFKARRSTGLECIITQMIHVLKPFLTLLPKVIFLIFAFPLHSDSEFWFERPFQWRGVRDLPAKPSH